MTLFVGILISNFYVPYCSVSMIYSNWRKIKKSQNRYQNFQFDRKKKFVLNFMKIILDFKMYLMLISISLFVNNNRTSSAIFWNSIKQKKKWFKCHYFLYWHQFLLVLTIIQQFPIDLNKPQESKLYHYKNWIEFHKQFKFSIELKKKLFLNIMNFFQFKTVFKNKGFNCCIYINVSFF